MFKIMRHPPVVKMKLSYQVLELVTRKYNNFQNVTIVENKTIYKLVSITFFMSLTIICKKK